MLFVVGSILTCSVILGGLQGCSGIPEQPHRLTSGTALDVIDSTLPSKAEPSPSANPPAPPPAVREALLMPLQPLEPLPLEDRFDIAVDEAPAATFFMSLVADSDINMVVHPSVTGKVSLKLKNVTVDEAMKLVRQSYGYEYEKSELGYVVLPRRMQSRIFHVSYLNVTRTGESKTRVNSGEVSQNESREDRFMDYVSTDDSNSTKNRAGSTISTSSVTDFWLELKESIHALVGAGEGRSVVVTPHAGLVIVRALPSELREVEAFLEQTQESVHRQVILEAKVIEVQLSDGFQAGINWEVLARINGDTLKFKQSGGGSIFDGGKSLLESALNPGFGGVFSMLYDGSDFNAFVELLKSQGEVQVLSSPRVATVNNQKAVIKVGTDEYFITDINSNEYSGNTTDTSSVDIQLTPFFSGIALDVTPQINGNQDVILHIHPTISDVTDQTKTFTVNGLEQELPLAFSKVRESDSIVRARSGQLVVIGGLMEDISQRQSAGTPGLSDVPYFGDLFKHRKNRGKKTELVILLRPVVVQNQQAWNRDMHNLHDRIQGMRQPVNSIQQ